MNKLSIPYKGDVFFYDIAENFDELPIDLLGWVCQNVGKWRKLYYAYTEAEGKEKIAIDVALQKVRIEILRRFCRISKNRLSRVNKAFYSMYADEVADALKCINFVFTELNRSEPPLAYFKYKQEMFFSPGKNFSKITGLEFHLSDIYFRKYMDDGRKDNLRVLLAIHYRRRGDGDIHNPDSRHFEGDVREVLNIHQMEKDAAHFKNVSDDMLYSMLFWWQCFRVAIQKKNPDIFSEDHTKTAENGDGWLPLFRSLSQFSGNYEKEAAQWKMGKIFGEIRYLKSKNSKK